jgi:hypothetical protein
LYTGNGGTQTITNGIDVSGKGGLVWAKSRSNVIRNSLYDTARGANFQLSSNNTEASSNAFIGDTAIAFTSTGFTTGSFVNTNTNGATYVSWTFAKQPKFFDIVTYTGTGSVQNIAHNLGSTPGFIIVKSVSYADYWVVYHRGVNGGTNPAQYGLYLNDTSGQFAGSVIWNNTEPTSTQFTVGTYSRNNTNGETYVAYLFAHNAGGFPVSGGGSTNGISCGTYTGTGSPFNVELGYEPQWVLVKKTSATGDWILMDTMRGMSMTTSQWLYPNTSGIEDASGTQLNPTATGFTVSSTGSGLNGGGATYIYVAIRRGPMKTPTVGTSVYNGIARTGTGATATVSGVGFSPDLFIGQIRGTAGYWNGVVDRLRGVNKRLVTSQTNAEDTTTDAVTSFTMDGSTLGADSNGFVNESGRTYIEWNFRRAPGFFDEVCYTGTGANTTFTHNLGVVPELMIVKSRSAAGNQWAVYAAPLGNTDVIYLNQTAATSANAFIWNNTSPTSTVFTVSIGGSVNSAGATYVAYLFATCAGVSKVGSYTGNNADGRIIDCGFTTGARFVLIRRTDDPAQWAVWDSARGIVSGNDPYLLLNLTVAEISGFDDVDTTSTGFIVNATSPGTPVNVAGANYIFLAIA